MEPDAHESRYDRVCSIAGNSHFETGLKQGAVVVDNAVHIRRAIQTIFGKLGVPNLIPLNPAIAIGL